METTKARARRERDKFFGQFCHGRGIDIGVGRIDAVNADPILPEVETWDKDNGDATFMASVADETYDFVYASHILEHISNCYLCLKNWWRILRKGGYLILFVPERDLYEKRLELPSRWNTDHKYFFKAEEDDLPFTLGLAPLVRASLPSAEIVYLKVCDEGHTIRDPYVHSDGEYSLELVARKP